jgi:hypothetical protein
LFNTTLEAHRKITRKRGERATTVYRWLNAIPVRTTEDAIAEGAHHAL